MCACQLNEAVGSGRKGRLLPMAVIVLVWISKKQSLRWGFLRRQYIRGVCSGEKEQKNENRAKEKIKKGYGLDGFSVVPLGALGHKLYHKVDVMFRKDYLLPLVSHRPLEGGGLCITSRWRQPACDQGQPCEDISCELLGASRAPEDRVDPPGEAGLGQSHTHPLEAARKMGCKFLMHSVSAQDRRHFRAPEKLS